MEQPTKFQLAINLKTAQGAWPDNSARSFARADEAIE